MSSPSPTPSNELSTKANKGSADSPSDIMAPAEDSPSNTSLQADSISRFIEDESTGPTGLLPIETEDAENPSPTTARIESEINAFDDAFGDDRNGTVEQENDENEGGEGNEVVYDEEGEEAYDEEGGEEEWEGGEEGIEEGNEDETS